MSWRVSVGVLFVMLFTVGISRADCLVIHNDKCKEFSSLFGYEEVKCDSERCFPDMGGEPECTDIDTEYEYLDNTAGYYYSSTTEPGTTAVNVAQGNECIKRRDCNDCKDDPLNLPKCNSTLSWNVFLWGSTITPAGVACN